ncbi:hypothetical protein [Comamonas sp. NoAH]|uniref:hypothetical protein n=1 Tax=Comamonas halotolerans TaxID=3041496 RepID=UPI0024E0CAAE|nr:hypothetical protein [Comamonas sp. NoAH]
MLQLLLNIFLALASGVVGSVLTVWFMVRIEDRKLKTDTLRRMLGNRDDLNGAAFCSAVNEVLVVFRKDEKVLAALHNLLQVASTPSKPNIDDALVVLLKEAAAACKLSPSSIPDTAFLKVINRVPGKQ